MSKREKAFMWGLVVTNLFVAAACFANSVPAFCVTLALHSGLCLLAWRYA